MTNIKIYAKSVKFQWIYKLYNEDYNAFWKHLICARCSRLQDKIIWESNLNLKDAHKLVIKSKFWQDLLVWYSSLNFNDDSNKVTKTDFIWYNSHLKINDKVLYLKCMSENGIKKIEDLIDDNNRFLTYQMFLDKCNVNINAITYYGIISVIKKHYSTDDLEMKPPLITNMMQRKDISKYIYKYFIEKDEKDNFVKGIVKWEHKLDTELDGSMLFNDIYRITNDTKLRNFQFKLLHHILPNNKLLHKMGIKNSALCNFCNQEEDSILHYLWGCPVAKRFWTSFNIWLSSALDLEVFELSPKETVLGIFSDESSLQKIVPF